MDFLLLAQDKAVDTAAKTIPLLERVIAGGVPLICLAVAVLCGILAFWQMRKNNALEKSYREDIEKQGDKRLVAEKSYREDIGKQGEARLEAERSYRQDVERLLREMIERGEDSQEALQTNTNAVNNVGLALQQLTARIGGT
jgi:hypothetical protein